MPCATPPDPKRRRLTRTNRDEGETRDGSVVSEQPEGREVLPEGREVQPEEPAGADALAEEQAAADALAEEQAEAAAAEASRIGGPDPQPDTDPAERPVAEGGGGEAEGFEQAEDELVRQASHDDAAWDPSVDAFSVEEESERATASYGEGDELSPTEVTGDPGKGPTIRARGPA